MTGCFMQIMLSLNFIQLIFVIFILETSENIFRLLRNLVFVMKIVSTSYSKVNEFNNPEDWLERISFYTGIFEELAKRHEVISIERINYKGMHYHNRVQYYFIQLNGKVVLFPWRMHRFIKKEQPDVVLVH